MAAELDGWGNEIAEEAVAPEEIVQDTEGVAPVAEGEVAPLAEEKHRSLKKTPMRGESAASMKTLAPCISTCSNWKRNPLHSSAR